MSTNSPAKRRSFLAQLVSSEPLLIKEITPAADDLSQAQAVRLPLAMRPRFPWWIIATMMGAGDSIGIAIANLIASNTNPHAYDVFFFPDPASSFSNPFLFNPFIKPFDQIPPSFLVAFAIQIGIILIFTIGSTLTFFLIRKKVTVSTVGILVERLGKHQFARWDEITAWSLEMGGEIETSVITATSTMTWHQHPQEGVSRTIVRGHAGKGTQGYIKRARLLHAVIMARTSKAPITGSALIQRQQGWVAPEPYIDREMFPDG
jgi:hypothetical protein